MAQESSNSTLEMGTSDQVLVVDSKKSSNLKWIIGGVAMLVVIGVVVALVVVFSGNEAGGEETTIVPTPSPVTTVSSPGTVTPSEPTLPSTDPTGTTPTGTTDPTDPTDPIDPTDPTDPIDPTDPTEATEATDGPTDGTTPPPLPPSDIALEEIINGMFAAPSFNGTWAGNDLLFRNANGDLMRYDVDTATPTIIISNSSQILQQSSRVQKLSADGTQVVLAYSVAPVYRHSFLARYAAYDIMTNEVTNILPPGINETYLQNFVWGPSGTSLAFVYLNNIYYQENLNSEPVQVTTSGIVDVIYNGIPDWVYEEEVFSSNNAMWFSNDGSKLAYATFDDTYVRVMRVPHYGVPGSGEYQYTQHHEIRYPKPGTINPTVSVTLHDLDSNTVQVYAEPTGLAEPILKSVSFVTNESVGVLWTDRVQSQLQVLLCTLSQPTCTEIFSYAEPNGWIDNIPVVFSSDGTSFITILPQSVGGVQYKQIVQVSAEDVGTLPWTTQARTNTANTVIEILLWTNDDVIWYKATSVNDSADQHIYTVDSYGDVICFTCGIVREDGGQCLYNEAVINTAATRISINCAGPDVPQLFIYDTNGTVITVWDDNAEAATSLAARNVPEIIRLTVPVAPGLPEADVQIQVPPNYEQRTNVPLLVYVYGGPDSSLVTKQWNIDWGTSLVSRWNIAVAHIDARGSGLRGVANTFALRRRLGSVEVEDQISVTRHLQETYSWLDSNRTCIWGWSYGGYASSLALARGGDVFRCAAAVAPVVDWRFYDTIYTERYMDVPSNNAEGYLESSLLTDDVVTAYRNKRYFLVHGTADDNVHYQHAMLLSRLLQTSDVYFSQMSYTDEDHGLFGVRPHLYHALEKFLEENML